MEKKDYYIKIAKKKLHGNNKKRMIEQIIKYYEFKKNNIEYNKYKIGDDVYLKKGTLLHGTYKNIDGLREIIKDGLISSWFIDGRKSKYPSCVGVWNLKDDCYLKDYINFYSGGTIEYKDINGKSLGTKVIAYDKFDQIIKTIDTNLCFRWHMEQTKEARFLPSLVQDKVQIGIIFNNNNLLNKLLDNDILNGDFSDKDLKSFVDKYYYKQFLLDKNIKNDFFTDRESAILFGIPSNFIEGILVGKIYENDSKILNLIKSMLPNCYICNLEGKIIL